MWSKVIETKTSYNKIQKKTLLNNSLSDLALLFFTAVYNLKAANCYELCSVIQICTYVAHYHINLTTATRVLSETVNSPTTAGVGNACCSWTVYSFT